MSGAPQWTTTRPTTEGIYWARADPASQPVILMVCGVPESLAAFQLGCVDDDVLGNYSEFCGPISPPTGTA